MGSEILTSVALLDRTQKVQAPVLTAEELEKQNKKEAALALLRKNFPNTALTSATTTKTTKATLKPVSKTIVIMKLKQNAKALDPLRNEKQIPVKERRFFFARTSNNGYDNEGDRRSFWLPKVK